MDPRDRDMLKRALSLAEENNDLLKGMRRRMRIGFFFKVFYWVLILGATFGAYYFIQPYIDQLSAAYTGFGQSVDQAQGVLDKVKGIVQ